MENISIVILHAFTTIDPRYWGVLSQKVTDLKGIVNGEEGKVLSNSNSATFFSSSTTYSKV